LSKQADLHEIPLRIPRRSRLGFPARLLSTAMRLRGLADCAYSLDYVSDWTEGAAMRLAGIPWVVMKTNLTWDEQSWRWRCALARRIVCLSKAQLDLLASWREKLVLIPTGVDLPRFSGAAPASREMFGLRAEDLVLISVAHLVPVKGHMELIRAVGELRGRHPHLRLLLAGEGDADYTQQLKAHAAACGADGRVPALLRMCDAKILATRNVARREGFGAALVEAMAAGLPVIATRSGGPEDVVVPGETGWLVEAEGVAPLVNAIEELCADPDRARRMGVTAQERARALYPRELMIERYQDVFAAVLSGK
jgi:glycosyltransferase involved in cell wall biosynthesis